MEIHICNVKAKSQADNSDNINRPKPQDTQIGILRIYAFCPKIQQNSSKFKKI